MNTKVFNAFNIAATAPQPSIRCLQWSGDGQLIVTTKSAIFILTPDLGVNVDNVTLLKSVVHRRKDGGTETASLDLGWHKNLIEFDRNNSRQWAAETPEWGMLSLGSLDVSWRSAAISPSNLTSNAGCLLVTLNSNLELSLWCSSKNYLKEAWIKVQDITSILMEQFVPQGKNVISQEQRTYAKILHAQVSCIAWSQQADFGKTPNPLVDGSILALGNRAGSVALMRFDGQKGLHCIKVIRVTDGWITQLAWGTWKSVEPLGSEACLACGAADGSIILIKITQNLQQRSPLTPFGPEFDVHCDACVLDVRASESDKKAITALAWIKFPSNKELILVHAKPGILRFFRLESADPPQGHELSVLRLTTRKTSVGSSSLTPVVGITHVRGLDTLIVTLFDGSYHVVKNVSTRPTLADKSVMEDDGEGESSMTSAKLSRIAREYFVAAEAGSAKFSDMNATNGVTEFDGSGTVVWLHEASRPNDFSFKPDSARISTLVVARLFEDTIGNEGTVNLIKDTIENPKSFLGQAPVHVLRPILYRLSLKGVLDAVWPEVLQLLPLADDELQECHLPSWTGHVDHDIHKSFQRSIAIDLYGWDTFRSLRFRMAIAVFCWKSTNGDVQEQFGRVAQSLLPRVSHRFLKILVKHLLFVVDSLTEQDIPFVMRIVIQSLLEGSPPSLASRADELNIAIKAKFSNSPDLFSPIEPCPACGAQISLNNLLNAECPQGHVWARCSITTFILSTPMVRTCIGCARKAFVAPSSRDPANADSLMWIPEAGRSWIVDDLLEAARCCLYCGNRFIRIL